MTIESNIDEKAGLEKTIAIDKKIRTAANCTQLVTLVSVFINPIGLALTGVASVAGLIADHKARSNQKELGDITSRSPFIASLIDQK